MYAILTFLSLGASAVGYMIVAFVQTNMRNVQRALDARVKWLPH